MEDLFFVSKCTHKIQNYRLPVYEHNGKYRAKFPCKVIPSKARIFIRTWNDEQKYIKEHTAQNIQPKLTTYSNIIGANAAIGITDYAFVAVDEIEFGENVIDFSGFPVNVYLADFTADPADCPRCGGYGVVKDITIDNYGKVVKVSGKNKIKQRVLKALMTPLGTSPFDDTYGTELYDLVGKTITEDTRIIIQKLIVDCVTSLIRNQSADLTTSERIKSLKGITIDTANTDTNSDRVLLIKVVVTNENDEEIDCSINFNLE